MEPLRDDHMETFGEAQLRRCLARQPGVRFVQEAVVLGYQVDFLVNDALVIEVDGVWHLQKAQHSRDAAKDARLKAAGYHVLRIDAERFRSSHEMKLISKEVAEATLKAPQEKPCGAFSLPPDALDAHKVARTGLIPEVMPRR